MGGFGVAISCVEIAFESFFFLAKRQGRMGFVTLGLAGCCFLCHWRLIDPVVNSALFTTTRASNIKCSPSKRLEVSSAWSKMAQPKTHSLFRVLFSRIYTAILPRTTLHSLSHRLSNISSQTLSLTTPSFFKNCSPSKWSGRYPCWTGCLFFQNPSSSKEMFSKND